MKLIVLLVAAACACGSSEKPKPKRIVTDSTVEILDNIEFVGETAEWTPAGNALLDAVAATLQGNPAISLVEVRVYVKGNATLAEQRSQKVIDYLTGKGVGAERLQMKGVDGTNAKGHDAVQFEIVKRKE
jgi:outer membrane protein OmpA-like peptidoglycan-associated protein